MSDNLETLMFLMGKKLETSSNNSENIEKKEIISIERKSFDYNKLDKDISDFLKKKQYEIFNIFNNTYTKIGKILKDAQDKLKGNNQYNGLFYQWFKSMGFKKDKVYALISRYNLLIENSDKQLTIEKLPLSLSYEISKKSCPSILKAEVLNGKINSLKEFKIVYKKNFDLRDTNKSLIKKNEKYETDIKEGLDFILKNIKEFKNIEFKKLKQENLKLFFHSILEIKKKIKYIKNNFI
ncbi:hypothetical protein [Borreliella bissettiae]|uniref:Uncharacterized protein n=1 Tax=Borrelia bissettiae (strain DSM 17990 / CIP 109136 / DN127) TaxID=521010 RepID=G0ALN1_BORBD|nr:hypothetical protein [Borreliella bissettiae]AEL18607.1 conserved hypothetical protein [Borreliella bissettiae DN127]WKC99854.1 hypothetical protein QIA02_02140 [Borreliella bissettiae]